MFHTGNDQELRDLILQMMLESINKYQEYDAILYSLFAIFFAKLIRYYESTIETPDKNRPNAELAYDIIAFIQENHNDISLEDVARKFNYSLEYTSRYIKKNTGKTFMELLTDSRMKHAVSLLKSTNLSVSQIAFQIGYENTENFIRVFRKKYNTTPTAYRKSNAETHLL
jgi:AraC-like DNA-binding protein